MTSEEKALLLTVARVLRVTLREDVNADIYVLRAADIRALEEALAPFGPSGEPPINQEAHVRERGA